MDGIFLALLQQWLEIIVRNLYYLFQALLTLGYIFQTCTGCGIGKINSKLIPNDKIRTKRFIVVSGWELLTRLLVMPGKV